MRSCHVISWVLPGKSGLVPVARIAPQAIELNGVAIEPITGAFLLVAWPQTIPRRLRALPRCLKRACGNAGRRSSPAASLLTDYQDAAVGGALNRSFVKKVRSSGKAGFRSEKLTRPWARSLFKLNGLTKDEYEGLAGLHTATVSRSA